MYVCICNAVRERDLRRVAREHCGGAEQLYRCLGVTPQCRQCLDDAECVVEDARRAVAA